MLKKSNKISVASFFLIILLFVSFTGCKNENGISPVTESTVYSGNNVSVGFFTGSVDNDNVFIITEAKFVLRKLCLKASGSESIAEIKMEPFVVNLNVSPEGFITVAIATVPSANYHQLKLQLHKPNPQENISDPDFREANRSFSVVVKGTFNGVPFVFKSGVTAARGINIDNSPIFITPTTLVNFTVILNPFFWFYHDNEVMDPMNHNNRHYIEDNIRDSFKRVFRDLDMNGHPD
jgi:hypothetical protein